MGRIRTDSPYALQADAAGTLSVRDTDPGSED
jgi:hypothetical protein